MWSWVTSPVQDLIPGVFMQDNALADTNAIIPQRFNLSFVLCTTPVREEEADIRTVKTATVSDDAATQETVSYCLVEGSAITEIYPGDLRPIYQHPIKGSFLLTKALSATSGEKSFTINNLEFIPYNGDEHLTGRDGNGTYFLDETSSEPGRQRMSISLCIGGNEVLRKFDSGLVTIPQDISFPWIDITIKNANTGISSNTPTYTIHLVAVPTPRFTFSTNHSFTSGSLGTHVDHGDLLCSCGRIVMTNGDLISNFHLYPTFAEQKVGLDAVIGPCNRVPSPDGTAITQYVLFSSTIDILAEEDPGQGDILNNFGKVVKRNTDLISPFGPMPVIPDMGLDALARTQSYTGESAGIAADNALTADITGRMIVFSTQEGFFSEKLGVYITPGDLLTTLGTIYRTNKDLLRNFNPVNFSSDIGFDVDAVYILSNGEIWFSLTEGFQDATLGHIGHGDLLSENGRRILRNRDIVAPFCPLEDLDDFGLDGISIMQ